jgi:hypothetical protein
MGNALQHMNTSNTSFSPDGQMFCHAPQLGIDFYDSTGQTTFPLHETLRDDEITCITTLFSECSQGPPVTWVLCAGSRQGNLLVFSAPGTMLRTIRSHCSPVRILRTSSSIENPLTSAPSVLLAQHDQSVIVTIPLGPELLNPLSEIKPTKRSLVHPHPADSAIIGSRLKSDIFFGVCEFPAVVSVGSDPFLSLSSLERIEPGSNPNIMRKLWGLMGGSGATEVIPKAHCHWELGEKGKVAKSLFLSPDGRWIAVTDCQGRVTIIDSVFGHVTNILKGYRNGQVAWAYPNILLIFSQSRAMIVACSVPDGVVFDAVSVGSKGHLFQGTDFQGRHFPVFIDSTGDVILIDVSFEVVHEPEPADRNSFPVEELLSSFSFDPEFTQSGE